jgi:hypothetical protein
MAGFITGLGAAFEATMEAGRVAAAAISNPEEANMRPIGPVYHLILWNCDRSVFF